MKLVKYLGFFLGTVIFVFAGFLVYSTINWYNPPQELVISENAVPDVICGDSTLSILSWNIGYAGLGDDMDFFMDGGIKVRDNQERTVVNLDSINHLLVQNSSRTFMLVQEIDLFSKRSYKMNEVDILLKHASYFPTFAPNFVVKFVPVPPVSPIGQVNSGIMSLSKYLPKSSVRYGYPGRFGWPNRLFNLRRCMLVNRYPTYGGHDLVLINTHNSAYDDGSLKQQEMKCLKDFVVAEYAKGNYVIVGGDWNQSPPKFPLNRFGEIPQSGSFKLTNIDADFMPGDWKWVFDRDQPTNRYLNEPYSPGKTSTCILDFFLVSPNIEVLSNKTLNLNFRSSDHNPITMSFKLVN